MEFYIFTAIELTNVKSTKLVMKPYFSVVIPVYNKEQHVKATIESVLAQGFDDFEVIVVNDGSTDDSLNVLYSISDARIKVFSTENQGASSARNFGIENASADYIALLDADDHWYDFYLEEQKRLIESYPEQSVFATAQKICKYGKRYPCTYSIDFKKDTEGIVNYFKASMISSIIHTSAVVIHKTVFSLVGKFDPKIQSGQDTDLWIRIGLKYPVVFSKKVCSEYNFIPEGLYKSTYSMTQKIDLSPYEQFEKENLDLKRFLDLNRYTLAIQSRLWDDEDSYKSLVSKIELDHLNKKQRFLLKQSKTVILNFIKVKEGLSRLGIQLSAYK